MQQIIKKLVTSIIAIFMFSSLSAFHYHGGEISYQNIGGYTYKVQFTFYNDCNWQMVPASVPLYFDCTSDTSVHYSVTANKIVDGVSIVTSCSLVNTACQGSSTLAGFKEYVYETIVSLPPCGDWLISYQNESYDTYDNYMFSSRVYVHARLNNSLVSNSSPVFDNSMMPVLNYNYPTQMNFSGTDPDGDSLTYSLCGDIQNGYFVYYNSGYSALNFMDSYTPIVLDSNTGMLSVHPSTIGEYLSGLKVDEWRDINGVMTKIATTYREFSVYVVNNYSITPTLSGIDLTASNSYSTNDSIYDMFVYYDGNPINFRINGFDADTNTSYIGSAEVFDISWNNGLANTVFTAHHNATDSAYADFIWTPDSNDFNVNNNFVVNIRDYSCPYYAINSKHYSITLIEPYFSISNDTAVCMGENISIVSNSSNNFNSFNWLIDGNPIVGQLGSNIVINTNDYASGNHIIVAEALDTNSVSSYSQIKQMTLTIDSLPFEQGYFLDTAYCAGDSVLFDAGEADSYKWIDENGALQSTSRFYSPASSGLVVVEAYNNLCIAMDVFDVTVYNPPAFNLGNDTTITNNDNITLSMPYGYTDYLWSNGSTAQTLLIDNTFNWQNIITGRFMFAGICPSSDTIIVKIGSVGITSINKSDINIYPNPVNDVLFIELEKEYENIKLQLFDLSSKLLRNEEFSGKEYVLKGMNTLSAGNYFLKITIGDSVLEYKIIKN